MVRPNLRALMNFSMYSYFHISTTGVKCDVKHNTMPQSSCGLHESGAEEATQFSRGYMKFCLHFLYFSYKFDKINYRCPQKFAVKKHALIGDFFFSTSLLYNVGKIRHQRTACNLMLLSIYEFRKNGTGKIMFYVPKCHTI
jgi:hypothetical protein